MVMRTRDCEECGLNTNEWIRHKGTFQDYYICPNCNNVVAATEAGLWEEVYKVLGIYKLIDCLDRKGNA